MKNKVVKRPVQAKKKRLAALSCRAGRLEVGNFDDVVVFRATWGLHGHAIAFFFAYQGAGDRAAKVEQILFDIGLVFAHDSAVRQHTAPQYDCASFSAISFSWCQGIR